MKYLLLLLLNFIPIFIGCTNKPRNDAKTNVLPKTIIPTVVNQSEKQPQRLSINELTKQQLNDLESKSKINASLLQVTNNMMSFASSSELTDYFLGHVLTEKALEQRFNCELNKEIQIFDLLGEKQEVFKYSFKDTYFKIFHYPKNNQDYLACGIIKDPEIFAPFGITIGMSKNSFFTNLFNESSSYDFLTIDTVFNGSADGGINQFFVFKQDVLNEIIIKSDMDWIQFE